MEATIQKLISDVDAEFQRKHPDVKRKLTDKQDDAHLRKEWNEMFVQHAFKLVRGIRDNAAAAVARIDHGA